MTVHPSATPDCENEPLLENRDATSSSSQSLYSVMGAANSIVAVTSEYNCRMDPDELCLIILLIPPAMGVFACSSATVNIIGHAILRAFESHFLAGVPLLWTFKIGLVGSSVLAGGVGLLYLLVALSCPELLVLIPTRLLSLAFSTTAAVIGTAILGPTELLRGAAVAGFIGEIIILAFAKALSIIVTGE
ncbi:uncharacterized protein ARMOST_17484 [Armillaria ostoyae]|uniref:Uncharacterized protein n=1 Tax=Armillaria ostoyae TaxID=47428 RepID=A0A284RZ50_ARMOS|nr:uncharacterized protein ARMOST_17484 [Armillaria ostoyae]